MTRSRVSHGSESSSRTPENVLSRIASQFSGVSGKGGVDVHLKEQLVPRPLSYLGHQLSKRFELVVLKENIA